MIKLVYAWTTVVHDLWYRQLTLQIKLSYFSKAKLPAIMLGREKWPHVFKSIQQQRSRLVHVSKVLEKSSTEPQDSPTKIDLQDGPDLTDFIAGVVPRNSTVHSYDGQLRLEKGQKGRLRLPPWLKTEIPVGKNFSKIKDDLRGMYSDF